MKEPEALWPARTEAHAYLLGLFAGSLRTLREGSIELESPGPAKRLARLLEKLNAARVHVEGSRLRLRSGEFERALREAGMAAEPDRWRLPELEPPLLDAFVRGMFDMAGKIADPAEHQELQCWLRVPEPLAGPLCQHYPGALATAARGQVTLSFRGVPALDFLGQLYESATLFRKRQHLSYRRWASSLSLSSPEPLGLAFQWCPITPNAVAPFKARVSDSGYDLTLVREVKRFGRTVLYGSGLQVCPPAGWYFDVVPRSSIIKLGYIAANSVGVIDRSYRGEVMVPLIKLDPEAPELELPARVAQLIPRPIVHMRAERRESLGATERGSGGFGSTGK